MSVFAEIYTYGNLKLARLIGHVFQCSRTDDLILIMCAWREFRRMPGNFSPICPTV